MNERLSVESLRAAILERSQPTTDDERTRFEAVARRYEAAVHQLIQQIHALVRQVPELQVTLEDENEIFTSPAFPGHEIEISDQRLRITCGESFLLFDPTARALLSAIGQVEIECSQPIPFLIEKVLYLIPDRDGAKARWGVRSVETLTSNRLEPFTQDTLLKLLHAAFA